MYNDQGILHDISTCYTSPLCRQRVKHIPPSVVKLNSVPSPYSIISKFVFQSFHFKFPYNHS